MNNVIKEIYVPILDPSVTGKVLYFSKVMHN